MQRLKMLRLFIQEFFCFRRVKWCPGADWTHRHADFQNTASTFPVFQSFRCLDIAWIARLHFALQRCAYCTTTKVRDIRYVSTDKIIDTVSHAAWPIKIKVLKIFFSQHNEWSRILILICCIFCTPHSAF